MTVELCAGEGAAASPCAGAMEAPLPAGTVLAGRYEVEALVGAGAFGRVYRGRDRASGRAAALKLLRPLHAAPGGALRRAESRELKLLGRVAAMGGSAHVVRLLEPCLQWHGASPLLVMELVDGPSLKERLARGGPLPPQEAARIGADMAKGLAAIHAAGGVHRDVKPSNVRLRGGREPVLVDLGIARALWETQVLTLPGAAPMTPRYAAPEQLAGRPALPATDIYALGLCLHEMLTGELPLCGSSAASTLALRERAPGADPRARRREVPAAIAEVVRRCLSPAPERRPQAREVIESLKAAACPEAVSRSRWLPRGAALALALIVPGKGSALHVTEPGARRATGQEIFLASRRLIEAPGMDASIEVSLQSFVASRPAGERRARLPALDGLHLLSGLDGALSAIGWDGEGCRRIVLAKGAGGLLADPAQRPCPLPRPRPLNLWEARGGAVTGDADGDGAMDVVTWGERAREGGAPRMIGSVWFGADAGGPLLDAAFDITSLRDYHYQPARRLGDMDGDGCDDLVFVRYSSGGVSPARVSILWSDCEGGFSPGAPGPPDGAVAVVPTPGNGGDLGDVDGDGLLDLLLGPDDDGDPGRVWLLRGTGSGLGEGEEAVDVLPGVEEGQDRGGYGQSYVVDWDQDGRLDVAVVYQQAELTAISMSRMEVFLGDGTGHFNATPAHSRLVPVFSQLLVPAE